MIPFAVAERQAQQLKEFLQQFALRIEIAGSVRRKKFQCHDIEIVMIPDPAKYFDLKAQLQPDKGWYAKKGIVGGRYVQFTSTPFSSQLDLFFANKDNFGLLFAIRTGSAEFSKKLAGRWVQLGFHSEDGILFNKRGERFTFQNEEDLFRFLRLPYTQPEYRNA